MAPISRTDVIAYVEAHIGTFHQKRLDKLEALKLNAILKRKNPYLFKAKNVLTTEQFIRGILDAYLSSQEETLFGDFLEGLAVFVGEQVHNGYKPNPKVMKGIDLVFEQAHRLYIVEIKSGPNWGNSSQINNMLIRFEEARTLLQPQYPDHEIVAVNGCCYGKNAQHSQRDGAYFKLCGQDFWMFVSGDPDFYLAIIEPLGHQAKQRNEDFMQAYAALINRLTLVFARDYCDPNGAIAWEKLVRYVSERDNT